MNAWEITELLESAFKEGNGNPKDPFCLVNVETDQALVKLPFVLIEEEPTELKLSAEGHVYEQEPNFLITCAISAQNKSRKEYKKEIYELASAVVNRINLIDDYRVQLYPGKLSGMEFALGSTKASGVVIELKARTNWVDENE